MKKKKNTIYAIAVFLLISSCKEKEYSVGFKVVNNSAVAVKVFPVDWKRMSDTITLGASQSAYKVISGGWGDPVFAKTNGGAGFAFVTNNAKKLSIVFNNTDTVIHYKDSLQHTDKKYYNMLSPRNVFADAAYTYKLAQKKGLFQKEIIYTISIDDYNFAKQ